MGPRLVYWPTASSMNNSGTLTIIIIIIIIIKVIITAHCLPAESQHDKVRHQEGPAPRFVSVVRKPPDVAQAHRISEKISIIDIVDWLIDSSSYPMQASRKDILEPQVSLSLAPSSCPMVTSHWSLVCFTDTGNTTEIFPKCYMLRDCKCIT